MAISRMEGLDNLTHIDDLRQTGWEYRRDAPEYHPTVEAAAGVLGGNAIRIPAGGYLNFPMGTTTTCHVSFWVKIPNLSTGTHRIAVAYDASSARTGDIPTNTWHGAVAVAATGEVAAYREDNNWMGTNARKAIKENEWHHVELRFYSNINGFWVVYVDGALVQQWNGDTYHSSHTGISFCIGYGGEMLVDDLVVEYGTSGSQWGATVIETKRPIADGAITGFTGSYADIDDPLGSMADGVTALTSNTVGDKAQFSFESYDGDDDIIAVSHVVESHKDDIGARTFTMFYDVGGNQTDALTGRQPFLDQPTIHYHVAQTNPVTASAWTKAEVNALQLGVEITR